MNDKDKVIEALASPIQRWHKAGGWMREIAAPLFGHEEQLQKAINSFVDSQSALLKKSLEPVLAAQEKWIETITHSLIHSYYRDSHCLSRLHSP